MARPQQPRKQPRIGRTRRHGTTNRRQPWGQLALVIVAGLAVFAAALWLLAGGSSGSQTTSDAQLPTGPVTVAGVEAPQPVANLGTVRVDTPVRTEYLVRNTGTSAVTLGTAGIQVLEGC
ncbi:MAG: hypothetical protein Kow0010_08270 [Dehalococcoidia bacterium]